MKNSKKFSFIRYSNCWEDTDILLKALDIKENETGLSIASAGDNTLAMLIKNPKKVYALDVNKTQLYCLELKMCCFKCFTYEEMRMFLGIGKCNRVLMFERIAPLLSSEAADYFRKNIRLIKKGVIHTGKFERAFHIFRSAIIPFICGRKKFSFFSKIEDREEQLEYYKKHIDNKRMNFIFRLFFGYKILGHLGRDKDFYKYVEEKKQSGDDIKKRFEFGIQNTSNKTNPYISYIVNKTYYDDSLPIYLKKENFESIKNNIEKITLIHGDLTFVKSQKFDFFNLSDIFEYMSEDVFSENIHILCETAKPRARVVYWNMQNKRYIDTDLYELDEEKSHELFRKNKSWFYRDFLIYKKAF